MKYHKKSTIISSQQLEQWAFIGNYALLKKWGSSIIGIQQIEYWAFKLPLNS